MQIETVPVTVYSLQMLDARQAQTPRALPDGVRLERVGEPTPELARWLYGAVGGPWHWEERLDWSYQQWADELAEQGSEIWMLYRFGTPVGYCQLAAEITASAQGPQTDTEILYFGLMPWALGQGLGGVFLQHMITHAWNLHQRHALSPVGRVWVHTCSLDSEHALANYKSRGLELYQQTTEEVHLCSPLTSWQAQFVQPSRTAASGSV